MNNTTTVTKLSPEALAACTSRSSVIAALMLKFNNSSSTIYRWFRENNAMLTTKDALDIIKKETGLTDKQILI